MVTIFSQGAGKIVLSAFGIKKLTSKRLSHFEIGNFITFNYLRKGEYLTLGETDLKYGHSEIKGDEDRLAMLYSILFVLNKILPEEEPEDTIFKETLSFLKKINSKKQAISDLEAYLRRILIFGGFIDTETMEQPQFDVIHFTENLIGEKFKVN